MALQPRGEISQVILVCEAVELETGTEPLEDVVSVVEWEAEEDRLLVVLFEEIFVKTIYCRHSGLV